jgi:multicomponent Na+:H+ antiporter subunit D
MNDLVILLILIPFTASFISLLDRYLPHLCIAKVTSLGGVSLCLIFLTVLFLAVFGGKVIDYPLGGWTEPIGISLYMDGLAWITSLIGMLITLLSLVFAGGEGKYQYKFYFFFLILLGGMEGVILTGDLFNMFVFFEILSIASYILIAHSQKEKSIMASFNYLLISSLGMGFFLLGIALLYQQTGILSLREIAHLASKIGKDSPVFTLSLICLVVGIGVKAAFIPLHTWLPDAHAYAPHPVSAILSGVMIKVSFLSVWRILKFLPAPYLQQILMWIGGFTAFLAIIWAVAQIDSKKLLAYSSISQMGFIIASFGVATSLSLVASFYHILNHSLFKSLLFLSVGVVIYITGKRDIDKMAGLGKKMPLVGIGFLIGALSISGIPPFNGYVSKSFISLSLKGHPLIHSLIFLASVGTVASFIKLSRIFRGRGTEDGSTENRYKNEKNVNRSCNFSPIDHLKVVPRGMLIPVVVLSILCLGTGIFPTMIGGAISKLLLGHNLDSSLPVYSTAELANSILILGLGLAVYLLTTSSKGRRTLKYIRSLRPGLNNSLLLIAVGFLLLVVISWMMEKGLP